MNSKQFDEIMNALVSDSTNILSSAEKEYATDEDRLSNFKSIPGVDPELVCFVYLCKHIDGIRNYVTGRARTQRDSIRGRISDAMNYLILLNAIIVEKETVANVSARDLMFADADDDRRNLFCSHHDMPMSRTAQRDWYCPLCDKEKNLVHTNRV